MSNPLLTYHLRRLEWLSLYTWNNHDLVMNPVQPRLAITKCCLSAAVGPVGPVGPVACNQRHFQEDHPGLFEG